MSPPGAGGRFGAEASLAWGTGGVFVLVSDTKAPFIVSSDPNHPREAGETPRATPPTTPSNPKRYAPRPRSRSFTTAPAERRDYGAPNNASDWFAYAFSPVTSRPAHAGGVHAPAASSDANSTSSVARPDSDPS